MGAKKLTVTEALEQLKSIDTTELRNRLEELDRERKAILSLLRIAGRIGHAAHRANPDPA